MPMQYPLTMKQQFVKDPVLKDIYKVSGNDLAEIKQVIQVFKKKNKLLKTMKL